MKLLKGLNGKQSQPYGCNSRDNAIEIRGVIKRFYIYEHRVWTLRELFVRALNRSKIKAGPSRFSLNNVWLTIGLGETWALIGPNGAGKSTLLRLMAGIYWPTTGVVLTRGRLSVLIELGAGFHPDLTGRENVYLYGSILGISKDEISQRYSEITEFAMLQPFMDTPVKYYSSGMSMRLGFSVATAIQPDILLLDEVLAVGDEAFRGRCFERLERFQNSGCTIVMATHDLNTALTFSSKAAWIEDGQVHLQGRVDEVIAAYKNSFQD